MAFSVSVSSVRPRTGNAIAANTKESVTKEIRYKGIVCDRCGVEVTEKKVRRERMGHIQLVVPVAHIWFFRSLPNKIGALLGIQTKKLESIIYYEKYVVIQPGIKAQDGIEKLQFLSDEEYYAIIDSLPADNQLLDDEDPNKFIAKMGGEALYDLLKAIDLDALSYELRDKADHETSQQRKQEALKRLNVVEAFRDSQKRVENRPEWMNSGHSARLASFGAFGRRPVRYFRLERLVPSGHHPQQPSEEID